MNIIFNSTQSNRAKCDKGLILEIKWKYYDRLVDNLQSFALQLEIFEAGISLLCCSSKYLSYIHNLRTADYTDMLD